MFSILVIICRFVSYLSFVMEKGYDNKLCKFAKHFCGAGGQVKGGAKVIELNAGEAKRLGLKRGDVLKKKKID